MSKVTIEFNLPEEQEDLNLALKANDLACAIFEIRNQVFRPARKHGYGHEAIDAFIQKNPDAVDLIYMLEQLFTQVLDEHNVLEHS